MIVAITGGTGFIGRKLVMRHVELGNSVRLLSRQTADNIKLPEAVRIYQGDLIDERPNLHAFIDGVDVLYHCAGEIRDQKRMYDLHVTGTRRLIDAAKNNIIHWVQLSSVGVYGPAARGAITEDSVLNPAGLYGITKTEAEKIVIDVANNGGFSYTILRPSNVFGAGMINRSLFSMISMITRGLFFYIGKPGASANYIHVDNVVEGLIRCGTMHQAQGRAYNLSDHCTLQHFIEVIADALDRPCPRLTIPEPIARLAGMTLGKIPGFPLTQSRVAALTNRSMYPILRIQKELGYNHIISIEDGLRDMVEAYKQSEGCR